MDNLLGLAAVLTLLLAYFFVRTIERSIRKRFKRVQALLSATTAYDLCLLYRNGTITRRKLVKELDKWQFEDIPPEDERLKTEWRSLLPPDPFGSFEEQVGRAYHDGIIDENVYNDLVDCYKDKRGIL